MEKICRICDKGAAEQMHHKLSQTTHNRRLYKDYIDHPDNLIPICFDCHMTKSLPKWTEIEFCRHFDIKPRTKSGLQRWQKK